MINENLLKYGVGAAARLLRHLLGGRGNRHLPRRPRERAVARTRPGDPRLLIVGWFLLSRIFVVILRGRLLQLLPPPRRRPRTAEEVIVKSAEVLRAVLVRLHHR